MVFGDFSDLSGYLLPPKKNAALRREVGKLVRKYGKEQVVRALVNPVGRPRINDRKAINNMYKLLRSGEAKTPSEAARKSIHLTKSKSQTSSERRLRDKFNRQNEQLGATMRILGPQAFETLSNVLLGQANAIKESFDQLGALGEIKFDLFSGAKLAGLSPEENDDENTGEN